MNVCSSIYPRIIKTYWCFSAWLCLIAKKLAETLSSKGVTQIYVHVKYFHSWLCQVSISLYYIGPTKILWLYKCVFLYSGILFEMQFPQLNHQSRPLSPPSGCFCRRFSNLRDQPLFSCNHCQNCQNHCQNCLNFGDWVLAKQLTITITHLNTIYYNFLFLVFINILIN